jgi:hypothetical protein
MIAAFANDPGVGQFRSFELGKLTSLAETWFRFKA